MLFYWLCCMYVYIVDLLIKLKIEKGNMNVFVCIGYR